MNVYPMNQPKAPRLRRSIVPIGIERIELAHPWDPAGKLRPAWIVHWPQQERTFYRRDEAREAYDNGKRYNRVLTNDELGRAVTLEQVTTFTYHAAPFERAIFARLDDYLAFFRAWRDRVHAAYPQAELVVEPTVDDDDFGHYATTAMVFGQAVEFAHLFTNELMRLMPNPKDFGGSADTDYSNR